MGPAWASAPKGTVLLLGLETFPHPRLLTVRPMLRAATTGSCLLRGKGGTGWRWLPQLTPTWHNKLSHCPVAPCRSLPGCRLLSAWLRARVKSLVCCMWPGYCQITCGRCDCSKTFATVLRQMGARTFLQVPCQYDLEAPDVSDWLP